MVESISPTTSPEAANQHNLRRLLNAIRSSLGTLNLLIAVCDNPVYRDEIIRSYEAELQAQGVRCHRVQLDPSWPSLKNALIRVQAESAGADAAHVVTVLGASELLGVRLSAEKSAQETFFFSVQWTREGLRQFQFPVVLWVTQAIATGLAQRAPDFWSWRGGTFEFTRPIAANFQGGGAEWLSEPKLAEVTPLADPQELQQQIAALEADDPTSPLLASLYSSLGQTYYDRLEQGKAEDYHREQQLAIAALQQAIARSTDDPLQLARNFNTLGLVYASQGRYAEAEPLYTQALEIRRSQLGPDHPTTASCLNNLAGLYASQGQYAEAEPLLTQALEIRRSQLGPDHPSSATSLHHLAGLYYAQGRYAEAEPLYTQALEIMLNCWASITADADSRTKLGGSLAAGDRSGAHRQTV
ncbi:Flp pilus assembly protein TadD [Leptolyngbyaceae cyanobacterium JSC-12]|nr:Flp pilus assembly protein TadD [Leptolyngbyaceae cyanobacterium JSC-12]